MNFDQLVTLCSDTHQRFVVATSRALDTHLVARNFILGLYIVHCEQEGEDRAAYGKQTLKALSTAMKTAAGRGFSVDNLELMRRFYIHFRSEILRPEISEKPSRISNSDPSEKSETLSRKSEETQWLALPSPEILGKLPSSFPLGWSHYVELLTIESPDERRFYEIEAAANQWSVRELQRQIASSLYERLALSRDKEEIRRLATEGQIVEKAADLIKNPLHLRQQQAITNDSHRLVQSLSAPTVRPIAAQGKALGPQPTEIRALKGRPKTANRHMTNAASYAAPSGLDSWKTRRPRAMPWAGMTCPVGAKETPHDQTARNANKEESP